jgi:hypothetical protein
MPVYLFQNPETLETKEVILTVGEEKIFVLNGVKWDRIFTVPTASIDTKIDPMSQKQFVDKTRGKKGKLGDLFEQSRDLSEKRSKSIGIDPLKSDYYKRWSEKRNRDHPDIRKNRAKAIADKAGIDLEI